MSSPPEAEYQLLGEDGKEITDVIVWRGQEPILQIDLFVQAFRVGDD